MPADSLMVVRISVRLEVAIGAARYLHPWDAANGQAVDSGRLQG